MAYRKTVMKEHRMILVTGAAGLSGSAVVRELSRNGVPVRALVRSRAKAGSLAALPGVDLVEGDMARAGTLGSALEGVDRALMMSGADPQMVETQCRFANACKTAGVAHVVKLSARNPASALSRRASASLACTRRSSAIWKHPASPGRTCAPASSCKSTCAKRRP
jgi:uncharacterized protein YbjT (DUF2867 family)